MTGLRPHRSWCGYPNTLHSTCHLTVDRIDVAPGVTVTVEITQAPQVDPLVAVLVDRGGRRQTLPLAEQPADRLALALQAGARMIRHDRQH